jgi:hypothetical protein
MVIPVNPDCYGRFPESSGLPVAPIFLAFHAVPVAMDQNKILN